MAQPNSIKDREWTKFVESPTRPGNSAVEVVGSFGSNELSLLVDEVSPSEIYLGTAIPGSLPSEAKWLIKKITISGGSVSILMANGSSESNQIWNDRSTLTYV